jgi:hypothetical protein
VQKLLLDADLRAFLFVGHKKITDLLRAMGINNSQVSTLSNFRII